MILEILIILLTTIVMYYVYCYKKVHWHFKQRGVKFLPGVPIFGNTMASTLVRRHYLDDLSEAYQAFPDERYVGFLELTMPAILIRDPELMKNIIIKDHDHFTDHREFFSEQSDPLFAGSLFLMKGQRWRDMRTTLSPAFTASKMKQIVPSILDISENIVEYLNEHIGEDIDVDDLMRRYTNDVIATAGFGAQVNSVKDRDNHLYKTGSTLFDFNFKQKLLMVIITQFPALSKKIGVQLFTDKVYDFFTTFVANTIEYRRKEKVKRPDMIQLLMQNEKDWTPQELTSQVFGFFAAGFESSASGLALCIHELALNPEYQDKLYQECKKFQEEKELTFENLGELKYVEAVINETLRKWSPAIVLDRVCNKPYELPPLREGCKPYPLKPGDLVYNLINQVHLDEKYWPDPHKFNPERFTEENKHNIKPFTFMPFGVGPRGCIGIRFAMMELKVLIYRLALNFKIVRIPKTSEPIVLAPHTFIIKVANGTFAKFEKRIPE